MSNTEEIQGIQLFLLLIAIALAAFLISLDGFIVNVAIPTISGELGVREDIGSWIITVFTIANTLCIPLSGKLSMRFGNMSIFLVGLALFCLSSILCGLSNYFTLLLIFRVFQGAGAGLILPVSLTMIISHFPPEKRSVAIGFWSFFVMVGPAMGPMVGGWLSDYHWHWMFFINFPFVIFSFVIVLLLLKRDQPAGTIMTPDWLGIALLFLSMGALQVALNRGQLHDWFRSILIPTLLLIALIGMIFFIIWELFSPNPFLEFAQFKRRNFTLPSLTTGVGMSLLFSSFVLDSLWVQEVLGYTPFWAGLTLTPVGIFPVIFYPLMGRFVSLLDLRIWLILSFLLYAFTFFWLSYINPAISFWYLALPRLIQGIGFPIFTIPNSMLAVQGVKKEKMTFVISFFSFIRMLFVSLGIPLALTLWIHREAFYQTRYASKSFFTNPAFINLMAAFRHTPSQNFALTNLAVEGQASTLALADIYYLFAWIFIALSLIVLCYKKAS